MFLGVDHGTTAIRFATSEGHCWDLTRQEASCLSAEEIVKLIAQNLGLDAVDLVALSYSMGDGLTRIVRLQDAPNRGLVRLDGAGLHVGGGTKVFEAIRASGWPAILLPGIHRGSDVDPRLKVFSHGMSPEKVGLAYGVFRGKSDSFIVCDASSNTVTFAVLRGKIIGAIDAPVFAPGLMQGPLDVQAIRDVDSGKMTANQAFNCGGILSKMGKASLEQCKPEEVREALESLSLFAAMEINALLVLSRDWGEPNPDLFLAGSPATRLCGRVSELLGRNVQPLGRYAAAQGCAWIANDVFSGSENILGIVVDEPVRR
ncbi:MAG TPA: methanogenesis marker 12 protein [Methanothrix sp.]|nr:methanogenesis marker 12 protein [Methanothrix sp.]